MIKRSFKNCPRCGAVLKQSKSWQGPPSQFWLECINCNTYVNTYIPQEHQRAVHEDDHRYIGNFGAYGTGKTLTSREEVMKHIFITPNANILIGSKVTSQYEQTIKREFATDIPAAFVENYSAQKTYFDMINGARLLFRPFDDPDKIRSYNLSMFVIVEASETSGETYHQLKSRLRNTAATIPLRDENGEIIFHENAESVPIPVIAHDWRRGIVESNPDPGWIRTDVLLVSDEIHKHGKVVDEYNVPDVNKDTATSTHIASTDVNSFLPPGFIDELARNKPAWWVMRFLRGSFMYAEGLVYPYASRQVCETFEIPTDWKRIAAFDYGLSDDAVFLWGAIDEKDGILYIYQEVRTNDTDVIELAKLFKQGSADIPVGGWLMAPLIDPKSGPKRGYDKKSLMELFVEQGVVFQPGYVNIDARVIRTNTYINAGRVRIMDCCTGLIKELENYKYPERTLDDKARSNKPVDKNNHGINPLEWICMALPPDPSQIRYGVAQMYMQRNLSRSEKLNQSLPWQLQSEVHEPTQQAYGIDYTEL